jgi:hypothetical protein
MSAQGCSGRLSNCVESLRIGYRNFAHHFAIQPDVSLFAPVDELAVPYTPLAARRAQPDNPHTSEITFAAFAIDPGVDLRSNRSLLRQAITVAHGPTMPLNGFKNPFLGPTSCRPFSHSWHISFPLKRLNDFGLAGGS